MSVLLSGIENQIQDAAAPFIIFGGFVAAAIALPLICAILKLLGIYAVVEEREAVVYVLFGSVVGVLTEPGLYFLWKELGISALFVNWLGKKYKVDMRLDQQYLRSQAVNSEEGAPMGVGLWYEMYINDPVAYTFRNTNPRGSLAANVGNSTVRCLSNLPLDKMMSDRHTMSRTVRAEVSEKSQEWGYKLGSCYIRKVHFRDQNMIQQIQNKVVNRLRKVTSAIMQEGANQVGVITGAAEKEAAIDFGKASAIRPAIVGKMLNDISQDADVCEALFELLEISRLTENRVPIYNINQKLNLMLPSGN
ncbi:MAG: SPFH/Band 7/PHB domain protein [Oscillospiraceae bacterium]|jgi:regulator of protease activity HflC (stomatin/prohibitin superfamily)|nr:SPFH/Band 7/PHB domain protein [Oscillospiraceae bacterium]